MTDSLQPTQEELRCAMRQLLLLEQLVEGCGVITDPQRVQLLHLQQVLMSLESDTETLNTALQRVTVKREQLSDIRAAGSATSDDAVEKPPTMSIHDVPDNRILFRCVPVPEEGADDETEGSDGTDEGIDDSSEISVDTPRRGGENGALNTRRLSTSPGGKGGLRSAVSDTSSATTAVETVLGLEGIDGGGSPRPTLSSPSPSEAGSFATTTAPRSPMPAARRSSVVVVSPTGVPPETQPAAKPPPPAAPPKPELLQHVVWQPPAVAIGADAPYEEVDGDTPVKHKLLLLTKGIMRKPRGFDDKDKAMREQGLYCKACLAPLKTSFSAVRLGKSWDAAKFCYYTGYYYCKDCHPCLETSVIPARILNYWDFTPLSVCSDAKNFLELHHDSPMLCLSAVNPKLFELLPFLRAARSLRIQLNILVDIGNKCKVFRAEFFGERPSSTSTSHVTTVDDMVRYNNEQQQHRRSSNASRSSPPRGGHHLSSHQQDQRGPSREEVAYIIPASKRYLVQDSEFWSLADLIDIKSTEDVVQQMDIEEMRRLRDAMGTVDAQGKLNTSASMFRSNSATKFSTAPTAGGFHRSANGAAAAASGGDGTQPGLSECELTKFLKQTRSNMVRHVVQLCRQGSECCFRHAAQLCPLCKKKDFIYIFDLNRTRTCTRCGSCYHRECWQRRKGHHTACVVCISSMVINADQSPRGVADGGDIERGEGNN
ncbi:Hypothetical protein, putative [Bodo saltans]|uniref:Rubicon Homology domain-containing protein n=1 Tax=Bodo saltans TaxID=75058 RepID=A0A0S4JQE0_BODSA|nr:Hypothetical protein, putative [Bodo saltans]|eukprot:CUG92740.1 Hypothetical protein, putative [Bodo saltans]